MPIHFQRLENALKRANEYLDVGKSVKSLEILSDVLKSKKHRVWQAKHEEIMYKFLELCVTLQKSFTAKEGLYQYKIICQQTYIKSFEDVVKKFLELAEQKALEAQKKCKNTLDNICLDDLESLSKPEELLLCAVSSEDTQDRNERVILLPWVKFLWDSYRHCLELIRNNPRTERLYHDIAHQTFQFCIKYNRKPEMRKLCDSLHTHLDILKKLQINLVLFGNQNIINLNNPESQSMQLETRIVQLDSAIQMELWQEAYKATDDIKKFGLISLAKKQPKPQLMATYYQKLSLVFKNANCPLFHAAALFKNFNLIKELKKNITADEIGKLASKVVISTLTIPIPPTRIEIDKIVDTEENVIENHQRNLASLLGLSSIPTRQSLIRDLEKLQIIQHASDILKNLYKWLEIDFNPLLLCKRVESTINEINENEHYVDLRCYVNSLKELTLIRLLKELAQIYQTLEFKRLLELCPFVSSIYLERIIVNAARRNDLNVRVDHRNKCLYFGTDLKLVGNEEVIEGPYLQSSPSDQIRRQLSDIYSVLNKAILLIEPFRLHEKRAKVKSLIMESYLLNEENQHRALLDRQDFIERKKEELEQKGIEREKEERRELEEKQQKIKELEEERLRKEQQERDAERKEREIQELQKRITKDQIDKIKKTDAGQRMLNEMGEDALYELKPEEIKNRQWKQLEKERKEQSIKQKKIERRIDHFERAKRLEEISLLKQEYEEVKVKDKEIWKQLEKERIAEVVAEHEQAFKHKERLFRMLDDAEKYMEQVQTIRHEMYITRSIEWEKKINEAREAKLLERKAHRKSERKREYILEKQRQEAKRVVEEARKKLQDEYAEVKRKADLQLKREKEAEERREQDRKEREESLRQQNIKETDKNRKGFESTIRKYDNLNRNNSQQVEKDFSNVRAYEPPSKANRVAWDEQKVPKVERDFSDLRKPRQAFAGNDEKEDKFSNVRNRLPDEGNNKDDADNWRSSIRQPATERKNVKQAASFGTNENTGSDRVNRSNRQKTREQEDLFVKQSNSDSWRVPAKKIEPESKLSSSENQEWRTVNKKR